MAQFPKHWWQTVIDPSKPVWEILPHEAAAHEVILSKRNELGLLSNLAPTPFTLDGTAYASVEALWQMTKLPENEDDPRYGLPWPCTRQEIQSLSGLEAKRLGDLASGVMKEFALNWVSYRGENWRYPESGRGPFYALILAAMTAKLEQNPAVREVLEKTGDLTLRPDHTTTGPLSPAHRYHEMWMEIRDGF